MLSQKEIEALPYRSCVGLCLTNAQGLIWAGERIDTPGAWQMPQGGVDKGEQPEQAAYRELEEETGLQAQDVKLIRESADWLPYDLPAHLIPTLWKGRYRGQKQKWFRMELVGSEAQINIETEIPEFARWQWIEPEALLEAIVPFKRDLYFKVLKGFDLL